LTTKLYRSATDRKIFGVCGGLGQTLNIDSTLLRFVVVIATIFSGGTAGLLYLVAGLIIPEEPAGWSSHHQGYGFDPAGGPYGPGKHQSYCSSSWCGKNGKRGHAPHAGHGAHPGAEPSMHDPAGFGGMSHASNPEQHAGDNLDSLMRDLEAKALRKEIEELKQRLAKYEQEKGES